jgi:ribokinase
MFDFVAVGDVMLDVRLPAPVPGTRQHASVEVSAGGSAANAAVAAARLGVTSAVVGAIGDDAIGAALESELGDRGVVALLRRVDGVATGATIYAGDAVVADRGANARISVPELPLSRVTLVSAYLPAEARAAALAAASGIRAVDLQGVLDDEPGAAVVLGPNLDLDELAGRHDVVCSTLGVEGAEAVANGERVRVAPSRVIEEAMVGAGDAFAAGFLLALADGLPLADCLKRGCDAVTQ